MSYRLTLDNSLQEGGGPPVNLRVEGDGFSGSGRMLIAQPSVSRAYRIAITWDLSAMDPGAEGVSTYGDGDVILPVGTVDRLAESIFMAGHLKRYTPTPGDAFSAVWLGDPGFDLAASDAVDGRTPQMDEPVFQGQNRAALSGFPTLQSRPMGWWRGFCRTRSWLPMARA